MQPIPFQQKARSLLKNIYGEIYLALGYPSFKSNDEAVPYLDRGTLKSSMNA